MIISYDLSLHCSEESAKLTESKQQLEKDLAEKKAEEEECQGSWNLILL